MQVWSLGWKIPWRRKWQPLQYCCLENSTDRGAWWTTVHGVPKSQTWLSNWVLIHGLTLWVENWLTFLRVFHGLFSMNSYGFLHHLASLVHYSWKLVNINCFCVGNINMLWMGDRKISEMWLLRLLTSKYTICIFIFVDSWGNKGKILLSKLATWWHCVSTQMSLGEVLCSRVMLWKDSCWCRGSLWSVNPHHLLLSERSEPQTLSLFQLRNPEHFNSKISYKMKHLKVWYLSTALPIP